MKRSKVSGNILKLSPNPCKLAKLWSNLAYEYCNGIDVVYGSQMLSRPVPPKTRCSASDERRATRGAYSGDSVRCRLKSI